MPDPDDTTDDEPDNLDLTPPVYVHDHDLWISCGEDPSWYVYFLRQQGRLGPTEQELEYVRQLVQSQPPPLV